MNRMWIMPLAASFALVAESQTLLPNPSPVFRPKQTWTSDSPVSVESKSEVVADNGLYRRVETTITFTNPNSRVYEGELEFPLPDGATVCGYALDVNGVMEQGVVCEKEKARMAFDNERRKGVDPGIVEHVKGNLWKTRIYPLMPRVPRKAMVAYVEPLAGEPLTVAERDPETKEVFVGARGLIVKTFSVADRMRAARKATILWDASFSRYGKVAADRARLELLPERGEWTLVVFRNVAEEKRTFTSRAELLAAIDAVVYDGGTSFAAIPAIRDEHGVFLFTDETDTLSVAAPDLESLGYIFASRPDVAPREICVRKAAPGETLSCAVKDGRLLAVAWAANRIADLSAQADARKDEFLALGRKYGVASPVTSLIVLESLEQYLEHKIEPPASSRFHDDWKRRRAAEDDPIVLQREKAAHEEALLRYWEERVTWWKDPIPKVQTPKSGVFDGVALSASAAPAETAVDIGSLRAVPAVDAAPPAFHASMRKSARAVRMSANGGVAQEPIAPRVLAGAHFDSRAGAKGKDANGPVQNGNAPSATVEIAKWDPKMPYLASLSSAPKGRAYAAYLKERDVYGKAPSFYLDCAGWFFKAGETALACRILSNLAEMKLEDVGLWRTMGWRLREAGAYDAAVDVFRHVLAMCGEEPQSGRDLALVLVERGKERHAASDLTEAAALLKHTAFTPPGRKIGRWNQGGNGIQTCVLALEELNGLLAWCAANPSLCAGFVAPDLGEAYRRDLPLDLRIVLSWDTDETDVDLHVLEPSGDEAYYGHRRTAKGGFVSEDVTTGYGPEEYLMKQAEKGVYKVMANYYASHRQAVTGAATVTATVYTGWATSLEKRQVLSFRLDSPKDKHPIGSITIE